MPKLTVWIAEQGDDHPCYNLIGRTRKSVKEQIAERIAQGDRADRYEAPVKVEIEYRDAFDLFDRLTCEGGGRHKDT